MHGHRSPVHGWITTGDPSDVAAATAALGIRHMRNGVHAVGTPLGLEGFIESKLHRRAAEVTDLVGTLGRPETFFPLHGCFRSSATAALAGCAQPLWGLTGWSAAARDLLPAFVASDVPGLQG
eukprot:jgi/Ulvmu1/4909/UM201_0001.1